VIDLGRADGALVRVSAAGWRVKRAAESGPLFRRSRLTSRLPIPVQGGDLAELRDLLNVSDGSWPLLMSWLVAALLPDIAHPILFLTGEQGQRRPPRRPDGARLGANAGTAHGAREQPR